MKLILIIIAVGAVSFLLILGALAFIGYKTFSSVQDKAKTGKINSDFNQIKKSVEFVQKENPDDVTLLCNGGEGPCFGKSTESGSTNSNGTGWVKVDLTKAYFPSLPLSPINNSEEGSYYQYCSDNINWAIVAMSNFEESYAIGSDPELCQKLLESVPNP